MIKIVVIDGQGGGCGRSLIEKLCQNRPDSCRIVAVGTNAAATAAMIKAGADAGATGENAVKINAATADIVVGPIGIVLANSLMGEVTPSMATAVASSTAKRVLVPMTRCATYIAGVGDLPMGRYIEEAVTLIRRCAEELVTK